MLQWKTIKVVLQCASWKQQKISVVLVVNTSCQTGGLCKKSLWSPATCWSLELIGKSPWNEWKEEAESGLSWGTNWRGSDMSKTKACNKCLRPSYRVYEPISQAPKVTTSEQPNLDAFWSSIDTTLDLLWYSKLTRWFSVFWNMDSSMITTAFFSSCFVFVLFGVSVLRSDILILCLCQHLFFLFLCSRTTVRGEGDAGFEILDIFLSKVIVLHCIYVDLGIEQLWTYLKEFSLLFVFIQDIEFLFHSVTGAGSIQWHIQLCMFTPLLLWITP